MKNLREVTNELKSAAKIGDETKIRDLITHIMNYHLFPAIGVDISQGEFINRLRPYNKNGERIRCVKDVSYKPKEYNLGFQRASTPKCNMFYGMKGNRHEDRTKGCMDETYNSFLDKEDRSETSIA